MTRLLLCRHGETARKAHGRCHGRLDVGLSALGRRQAVALAAKLATEELRAAYTSPLRRARDTAEVVAARYRLTPISVDGLSEIDLGRFEGLTYEEAERRFPNVYRQWMECPLRVRFPDGEDYDALLRRTAAAIEEICGGHQDETVAVVTHAGPLRALLQPCDPFGLEVAYGSVTAISRS
jgi:alpha-ribazole phosphatase